MKAFSLILMSFGLISHLIAQPPATESSAFQKALQEKKELEKHSLLKNIDAVTIGPTVMSGRVVDLDVNPSDPTEFYAAYASGGLWHTTNNGSSFKPVLDNAPTINIGEVAVHWPSKTIWVGTGENNSSRSSYAGVGIFKSQDNGANWQYMGLPDSHHIGRILINPTNPNEVLVGVLGHLYSPNEERGVFKTTDGGKTWKKTLFVSENTGIIDLAHTEDSFGVIYAAAWQKDRKAWNFDGSGAESGIYKSTDGGNTWLKVTNEGSGFPAGKGVGRIGLAVVSKEEVYAILDNQNFREKKAKNNEGLSKDDFKNMDVNTFIKLEDKELEKFLRENNFPDKYNAVTVKESIKKGESKPADLAKYLENANDALVDTPVIGAEIYQSLDGGKTWKKRNDEYIDDLFYSYGYYFAQIRVDRQNKEKLYIAGVPLLSSQDAGRSWKSIDKENVHGDHHALWINPARPGHLINGNDGGVNISYDDGETWIKNNSPAVGQFYSINIDHQNPYHVYGGLQDNGVWVGPNDTKEDSSWQQSGHYSWEMILGGDGMQVQIDNRNPDIVYTGYQFGNYYRLDRGLDTQTPIQPKHELGESPYRFNWQTPILLSSHNQDIIYLGSNHLHRSLNQGKDWESISPDLTKGGKQGNVSYGTITTISESPFKFGVIYVGTDDGIIQLTRDGGGSWQNLSQGFPSDFWVSRVVASQHEMGRVYVSLNGYRWDSFTPYVYVSEDYGITWRSIAANLPLSPVNVITEDPRNSDLLYVGTDNGLYASLDRGASWQPLGHGLPPVAVHDVVVQPESHHLLVGTHGRSIYKLDISALQQLTKEMLTKPLYLFSLEEVVVSKRWGSSWSKWSEPIEPEVKLVFYSKDEGPYSLGVYSEDGSLLTSWEYKAQSGLNYVTYDLSVSDKDKEKYQKKNKMRSLKTADNGKTYLEAGKYTVRISGNGTEASTPLLLKEK